MSGRRPEATGAILFWIAAGIIVLWAAVRLFAAPSATHEVSALVLALISVVLAVTASLLYALYLIRLQLWMANQPPAPPANPPEPEPMRLRGRARLDEE